MSDGNDAVTTDGGMDQNDDGKGADAPLSNEVTASTSVAAQLKGAREALGLSLADVASRTRITQRHVVAVETGDYASLPGRPYAIGFARSYAQAVGLDSKAIAEGVRRELNSSAPRPEPRLIQQFEVGDPAKTPTRTIVWLSLALAFGVVAMGAMFWSSAYWPSVELPALVDVSKPAPAAAPPSGLPQPAQPSAPVSGPVVFTALEDAIWVKFYDGAGNQLLQKQLAKGESYTVPDSAVEPRLWTGRPDALSVTVGGRSVAKIADKEGIVKNVPVTAAALLARNPAAAVTPPVTRPARTEARRVPSIARAPNDAPAAPTGSATPPMPTSSTGTM
jgi:transcriptional regulator with XRE-family HTH domain